MTIREPRFINEFLDNSFNVWLSAGNWLLSGVSYRQLEQALEQYFIDSTGSYSASASAAVGGLGSSVGTSATATTNPTAQNLASAKFNLLKFMRTTIRKRPQLNQQICADYNISVLNCSEHDFGQALGTLPKGNPSLLHALRQQAWFLEYCWALRTNNQALLLELNDQVSAHYKAHTDAKLFDIKYLAQEFNPTRKEDLQFLEHLFAASCACDVYHQIGMRNAEKFNNLIKATISMLTPPAAKGKHKKDDPKTNAPSEPVSYAHLYSPGYFAPYDQLFAQVIAIDLKEVLALAKEAGDKAELGKADARDSKSDRSDRASARAKDKNADAHSGAASADSEHGHGTRVSDRHGNNITSFSAISQCSLAVQAQLKQLFFAYVLRDGDLNRAFKSIFAIPNTSKDYYSNLLEQYRYALEDSYWSLTNQALANTEVSRRFFSQGLIRQLSQLNQNPAYLRDLSNYNVYLGNHDFGITDLRSFTPEYYYQYLYLVLYRLYDLAFNQKQPLHQVLIIVGIDQILDPAKFASFYVNQNEINDRIFRIKTLLSQLLSKGSQYDLHFILTVNDLQFVAEHNWIRSCCEEGTGPFDELLIKY